MRRFDGLKMLKMLRGKRVVFVGDSLNRNMWESLICSLRESLVNKSRLYEVSGHYEFKTQGYHSFMFKVSVNHDFFKRKPVRNVVHVSGYADSVLWFNDSAIYAGFSVLY